MPAGQIGVMAGIRWVKNPALEGSRNDLIVNFERQGIIVGSIQNTTMEFGPEQDNVPRLET